MLGRNRKSSWRSLKWLEKRARRRIHLITPFAGNFLIARVVFQMRFAIQMRRRYLLYGLEFPRNKRMNDASLSDESIPARSGSETPNDTYLGKIDRNDEAVTQTEKANFPV